MPHMRRLLVWVCVLAAAALPLHAQGAASGDEKELAAYRLTLPTMNKVVAVMRTMAKEAMADPKYQQVAKIESQIEDLEAQVEKLQAKDELTKAEETKLEGLDQQLEKLRQQRDESRDTAAGADDSMNKATTLTEMEQAASRIPAFSRALAREGLSAREYAKFTLAMLQAGMVYGFSKGKVDYAKIPAGINPENVKFVEEHQAELNAMQKEFEALGKLK